MFSENMSSNFLMLSFLFALSLSFTKVKGNMTKIDFVHCFFFQLCN
jgi:hypothetical protein